MDSLVPSEDTPDNPSQDLPLFTNANNMMPEDNLPLVVVLNRDLPDDVEWEQRYSYGCSPDNKSEECASDISALEEASCPESFLCLTHSLENQHYCMPKCPDGFSACDGHCIDGRSNDSFCGANQDCSTFTVCSSNESCYAGKCIKVASDSCEDKENTCLSDTLLHACLDSGWITMDCAETNMKCIGGQCVNTKTECSDDTFVKSCLPDGKTRLYCSHSQLLHEICNNTQKCVNGECLDIVVEGDTTNVGCSDGEREGFVDLLAYPNIAGCSGGWSVPGIFETANAPSCNRISGDDSKNPNGTDCNIQDLCADGWHVCTGRNDVTRCAGSSGCADVTKGTGTKDGMEPPLFFLSREITGGALKCLGDFSGSVSATEDGSGCGNLGCPVDNDTRGCTPLNRGLHDLCSGINTSRCSCTGSGSTIQCTGSPCNWCRTLGWYTYRDQKQYASGWNCGRESTKEARNITKTSPELGGVLCCRDTLVKE